MRVNVLRAQIEARAGFKCKQSFAASASELDLLNRNMTPLPDYCNAKPRGGWTVHEPIWRSQPKWGEAPSRQLVMGMLPPTIPPGTRRFPTKLHIPIAQTHQRPHGAMGYCRECAEMRFQHCHQARSARNPRLRRVGIWAPRWVALVRACSRSIIRSVSPSIITTGVTGNSVARKFCR